MTSQELFLEALRMENLLSRRRTLKEAADKSFRSLEIKVAEMWKAARIARRNENKADVIQFKQGK